MRELNYLEVLFTAEGRVKTDNGLVWCPKDNAPTNCV